MEKTGFHTTGWVFKREETIRWPEKRKYIKS